MWWWWWCILVISSQTTTKIEAREFQRVLNGRISETRLDSCNERVLRALFTSRQCPTDVLQFINLLRCDIARKHHLAIRERRSPCLPLTHHLCLLRVCIIFLLFLCRSALSRWPLGPVNQRTSPTSIVGSS